MAIWGDGVHSIIMGLFPLEKRVKYCRQEWGKSDFDHHFAFLTNFLKRQNFLLSDILFGSSRGSFSKKDLSKTDLPFRFCKIGLRNTLFIFGRKNGRLLFVL